MGTDTIPTRSDGTTILATHPNVIRSALCGDLVPRNASGEATSIAGSLGTTTYPFLKASIASGGWILGDIKMHHTYNGAAPIGHGWMLCDGRVITEAAYNTEHGANTFATYVGSTDLLNKYLPNFTGKYPVGKATTPEAGTGAIAAVGNASHQVNLAHTHTSAAHNHIWYVGETGGGGSDYVFNESGSPIDPVNTHTAGSAGGGIQYSDGTTPSSALLGPVGQLGTNPVVVTTESSLSATFNVQPASIEVQYYMRVI